MEVVLASLMIIDILVYSIISSCAINPIIILEWTIVLGYLVVLYLLEVQGLGETDEIIEFTLLICRLLFVILRSVLIVVNLYKRRDQSKRNTILMNNEFDTQASSEFEIGDLGDKLDNYA